MLHIIPGEPTQQNVSLEYPSRKQKRVFAPFQMMDAVYEAFQEEYSEQKEEGFNTTVIDGMTGFIFSNRFGNLHNPQAVNRAIKRIYESYNAEEVLNAKRKRGSQS